VVHSLNNGGSEIEGVEWFFYVLAAALESAAEAELRIPDP
jgi:hypothetical protein